jgi:hypothetical protein
MEPRKQAIIDALRKFMNQRSGIEFGNYGDVRAYRSEMRSITKDLHHARALMDAVEYSDITADDLLKAAQGAFSGRLTIAEDAPGTESPFTLDYCTGQYFPTEYRRAVCAVLASALWEYTREHCMPPVADKRGQHGEEQYLLNVGGVAPMRVSAGAWLRAHFRQQFGRGIASRWFS